MFQCSNVPMFQCSNVQMFKCFNVPMFERSNVPMFQCSNVQMFKCFNVPMFKCQMSNVKRQISTRSNFCPRIPLEFLSLFFDIFCILGKLTRQTEKSATMTIFRSVPTSLGILVSNYADGGENRCLFQNQFSFAITLSTGPCDFCARFWLNLTSPSALGMSDPA